MNPSSVLLDGIVWLSLASLGVSGSFTRDMVIVAQTQSARRLIPELVYNPSEDNGYWASVYGREIGDVEHLEIRSNLISFVRALIAPTLRKQSRVEALE